MIFSKLPGHFWVRKAALVAGALALVACGIDDTDVTTGSRLEQPPAGTQPPAPIEAGDIAIAGQDFSHDIRSLPQIANASVPPLVQFKGVTSIVRNQDNQRVDVDTEPYTTLLRDRLLLGDREKLRFVERQLPPLTTHTGHGKHAATLPIEAEDADYQVLAELRGKVDSDTYRIQMEFVDAHNGSVLLNELYRIHKEAPDSQGGDTGEDLGQLPPPAAAQQPQPPPPPGQGVPHAADADMQSDVPAGVPGKMRDDGN